MINKLKTWILTIASVGVLLAPALLPATVHAVDQTEINQGVCAGTNLTVDQNCNPTDPNAESKVNSILKLIINLFSVIVGVIAVIMIIVGGIKYITSGGESSNVSGAKNTILYAVIGLIIVALAQIIVHFVLSKVSNS